MFHLITSNDGGGANAPANPIQSVARPGTDLTPQARPRVKSSAPPANPEPTFAQLSEDGTLRERFEQFLQELERLPDNHARMLACESNVAGLAPHIKRGTNAALRLGILFALNEQRGFHLAQVDPKTGKPLSLDATKYRARLLQQYHLGASDTQVSRNTSCGHVYLKLVSLGLPTAETRNGLKPLLSMHGGDLDKIAQEVSLLTDGGKKPYPKTSVLEARKAELRGDPPAKNMPSPTELREALELAQRVIQGETKARPLAEKRLHDLIVRLRIEETRAKGQKKKLANQQAKGAQAQGESKPAEGEGKAQAKEEAHQDKTKGSQAAPKTADALKEEAKEGAKAGTPPPDVTQKEAPAVNPPSASASDSGSTLQVERVGIVLIEREGRIVRTTLTDYHVSLFEGLVSFTKERYSRERRWNYNENAQCVNHPEKNGVRECTCASEAIAIAEVSALATWAREQQPNA